MIAVYVTGKYGGNGDKSEQIINSALYGVMVSILVCLALNWCMDMETQFTIMIGKSLTVLIDCQFF